MFLGTFTPRLDVKGRLALPAKFRPELDGGVVICKGMDKCLFVFTAAEFDRIAKPLVDSPISDPRVRKYARALFSSSSPESVDAQGRVMIPAILRKHGELTKDCVVVGLMNRLEIWDAQIWAEVDEDADTAFAEIGEQMPGLF